MEEKNIQNLSENDQTGSDRSMQQHDAKAKYMQTDFNAQIGEADTWLDKAKTLVRQNKLAAFERVITSVIAQNPSAKYSHAPSFTAYFAII